MKAMARSRWCVRAAWAAAVLAGVLLVGCASVEDVGREIERQREVRATALLSQEPNMGVEAIPVTSGELDLGRCIELALLHNKEIQAAKATLLEAKGQMTEAIATALPSGTFTGSALRTDVSGFGVEGETYELMVLARQPLYLGGLVGAALDAATVFGYMTQQQLRQSMHNVHRQVRQQYLNALLAEDLVAVAEESLRDAKESLADAQKRLDYGQGTRFDVLRAEVAVTAARAGLIEQRNASRLALRGLLNVLGVSQLSQVALAGELSYEAAAVSEEGSMRQALLRRPGVLVGEAMIRLAKDNVSREQAGDRPKVYLQGTYQRTYPGFGASFDEFDLGGGGAEEGEGDGGGGFGGGLGGNDWERTATGGVVVEWPFFDGFRTRGRVTQAQAEVHRQQIGLARLEQQVQLEVANALLNLDSAGQFVASQSGNVATAEESLRLARVGFREGIGTSLDVIDAETALARARADYIRAVHGYEVALVDLSWSMGVIGEDEAAQVASDEAAGGQESDLGVSGEGDVDEQEPGTSEEADR